MAEAHKILSNSIFNIENPVKPTITPPKEVVSTGVHNTNSNPIADPPKEVVSKGVNNTRSNSFDAAALTHSIPELSPPDENPKIGWWE
jgi:hypothetical protein